jgi:hypothetical protein
MTFTIFIVNGESILATICIYNGVRLWRGISHDKENAPKLG